MSTPAKRGLSATKRELLMAALEHSLINTVVATNVRTPDVGQGPVTTTAADSLNLPVVIENPSHDAENDLRRHRLSTLQTVRGQKAAMAEDYRHKQEDPDHKKLPSWVREAQSQEAAILEAIDNQFLPQHAPDQLISPQVFFMSKLFNVRSRNTPLESLVEFVIGHVNQGEVVYSGPEMRQRDGLVFMALLNIIRDVQVGKRVSFEPQDLSMALWGFYNGESRTRLRQSIFRLQHAVVRFPTFSVQLVQRFEFPKRGRWTVALDEDIIQLFKESRLVWLDLNIRQKLPEGLATWLYAYIESQSALIPWTTQKLRDMCGSEAKPREFNIILARALSLLVLNGIIEDGWSIKQGIVYWRKLKETNASPLPANLTLKVL